MKSSSRTIFGAGEAILRKRARRWKQGAAFFAGFMFLLRSIAAEHLTGTTSNKVDVMEMDLEALMKIEVTSPSKRPEKLSDAAAAIYVITQEDIRRSGVTSIPEALRMAPGVEVARINSNQWAIGVRGFGSRLSRSVLVLIDGRSVYNPLFAGTYWEIQNTLLDDI